MMEAEEKKNLVKRVAIVDTIMPMAIGQLCEFNMKNVSKESVRASCSRLKKKFGRVFRVRTTGYMTFQVERIA